MEKTQIIELRKQLTEVRKLLKGMDPNSDRHEKAKSIEAENLPHA